MDGESCPILDVWARKDITADRERAEMHLHLE